MESDGVREGFLEEGLPPADEATHAKSADRWVPRAGGHQQLLTSEVLSPSRLL